MSMVYLNYKLYVSFIDLQVYISNQIKMKILTIHKGLQNVSGSYVY